MEKSESPAQPVRVLYPPVVLAGAVVLMLALARWAPFVSWRGTLHVWIGVALLILGLAFGLWATLLFHAAGTTIKPFEESSALVTWGPYRVSRNPIYMGMVFLLLGLAISLRALSPFLVIPLFALVIQRRFIQREEEMLERKFGARYAEYRRRIRRWV